MTTTQNLTQLEDLTGAKAKLGLLILDAHPRPQGSENPDRGKYRFVPSQVVSALERDAYLSGLSSAANVLCGTSGVGGLDACVRAYLSATGRT